MSRKPSKSRSKKSWSLTALERREMLAADAGAAVASASAVGEGVVDSGQVASLETSVAPQHNANLQQSATELILIDGSVATAADVAAGVSEGADIILLDSQQDFVGQISQALAGRTAINRVHLVTHGEDGQIRLGDQAITIETVGQRSAEMQQWKQAFANDGDFLIYGCDVASSSTGQALVTTLASLTGLDVAASNDRTGHGDVMGDWDLEFAVGDVAPINWVSNELLAALPHTLNIEIWAAGSTGDELMELEINGEIVDTWFVNNTDADNGQFLPFFFDRDGVSADDIRINFVNDLYDPANGIDRNLRIDRIVVDGITYEAENAAVFGEGIYVDGQGIVSGNLQSEYINSDGYLQFSSSGSSTGNPGGGGSQLQVQLRGQTGFESAEVLVDGNVVGQFFDISTSGELFTIQTEGNITADRVRVAFTNDFQNGDFDQNLEVDFIRIDGQTFQTEAATTFSTGTWLPADGVQDGFRQSETLHANGYFQYLAGEGGSTGSGPGQFSIQPSQITINEGQDTVTIEVTRLGGSEGEVSVGYFTSDDSATAGQDYVAQSGRLFFNDGQASAFITIDLLEDSQAEGAEAFGIVLDAPVGTNILIPRTSTVTIIDNDSFVPGTEFFDESAGIDLNGVARYVNGDLFITGNVLQQSGSAFYQTPIAVSNNTSFQAQFEFAIGGASGSQGGEGMTFVLQNSTDGSSALGTNWYGLGYEGITNSLAIEIDTINNDFESGGARQISVVRDGVVRSHVATVDTEFVLNDSRNYTAWVDYNGNSNKLAVFISDNGAKPDFATLVTTIELDDVLGDQAYVGFTASSYFRPNEHVIRNFQMTFDPPPFDPPVRPAIPDGNLATETVVSGLNQPLAIKWADNGRNFYIAEKGGVLKVSRDGGAVQTVIDISGQVNDFNDRGLIDFTIHPDLANNPYAYLLYTYDPPEVYNYTGVAGPDGNGNRAGRLMRVTLDASTGYTSIVSGSETILLGTNSTWDNFNGFIDSTNNYSAAPAGFNADGSSIRDFIASDSQSHTVGSLEFGIDGNLFVSIGDGAAYTQVDPRAQRVQDVTNLSGKVLRIDPITGQGLSDNPFFTGDSNDNASKVFQLGLRNPWRLTVNPNSGQLFIGDTGWISYEEINTGGIGANFGWPYFEGSQGSNSRTPQYSSTFGAAAFYANNDAVAPVVAVSHSGTGDAIALGGFIDSNNALGDAFDDTYFYTNVFDGTVRYFRTDAQGQLTDNQVFTTNAQFIVDIQQGPDGSIYFANLLSGEIGRWQFV